MTILNKKKNGFTLIELLVVSTIIVLLLLSVSSMLMTFLLSNAKTNISRQIKAEGNQMISQIEFVLRSGKSISNTIEPPIFNCSSTGSDNALSSVDIKDINSGTTTLAFLPGATESYITLNGSKLNSNFVIAGIPSVVCIQDTDTKKTSIRIKFTLARTGDSNMKEDFESLIQLRNS